MRSRYRVHSMQSTLWYAMLRASILKHTESATVGGERDIQVWAWPPERSCSRPRGALAGGTTKL